jgi:hypothetical protein
MYGLHVGVYINYYIVRKERLKMSLTRQRCKVCWKVDKFDFHVPDDLWEKIVPPEFQNRVVCLACFDDFAKEKDIDYVQYLDDYLYFAGDRGTLIFTATSRIN